jgi:hypothetical protein
VFRVRIKDEVCTKRSHWKSLARSFLEQANVCPERPDLSQKGIQGRGLILEVNVGGSWCVNDITWELYRRFTLLKARQLSLSLSLSLSPYGNKFLVITAIQTWDTQVTGEQGELRYYGPVGNGKGQGYISGWFRGSHLGRGERAFSPKCIVMVGCTKRHQPLQYNGAKARTEGFTWFSETFFGITSYIHYFCNPH